MEKKIPVKSLYLMGVIMVGLVVLGVGSTYALFTVKATIDNPVYLVSNLSYSDNVIDTIDIDVNAYETKEILLNINNNTGSKMNYVLWYLDKEYDIDFGVESSGIAKSLSCNTICNGLTSGNSFDIKLYIRNNEEFEVNTTIGLSNSIENVVLSEDMKIIPNQILEEYYTEINNFEYTLSEYVLDNEILITKYIGSRSDVVIPSSYTIDGTQYNTVILSYDEKNDTGIFYNNSIIKDVTFKDNIKFISTDKEGNTINDSVINIFDKCTNNINVNISDKYTLFNDYNNEKVNINIMD